MTRALHATLKARGAGLAPGAVAGGSTTVARIPGYDRFVEGGRVNLGVPGWLAEACRGSTLRGAAPARAGQPKSQALLLSDGDPLLQRAG